MNEVVSPQVLVKQADCSLDINHADSTSTKQPLHHYAGRHFIVDFWGGGDYKNPETIEKALVEAAEVAGACLLHSHLHKFADGEGVTGVALLAESHISIHTWPEHNYAALDVFMCGDSEPEKAVELLRQTFQPERVSVNELLRGRLSKGER